MSPYFNAHVVGGPIENGEEATAIGWGHLIEEPELDV